jgi:hypothetical protein
VRTSDFGSSVIGPRSVREGERLHPFIPILLLQRQPDLLEPRPSAPRARIGINVRTGRRQRAAEERKIVLIREGQLQMRPRAASELIK